MAQTNQLMPGEWEAAGKGTTWGQGIFAQEAFKAQEDKYLADAVAMGNMDPRAAEGYYKGKLSRAIRGAGNKLFGVQSNDPALREANALDEAFSSLSEEDIKDPPTALNKIADHLAELGNTKQAIEYRLKASEMLTKQDAIKTQQEDRAYIVQQRNLTDLGRAAAGTLDGLFKANEAGNEAVATGIKDSFLKVYARINGQEEADKLSKLPPKEFETQVAQIYESSKTMSQQVAEGRDANKNATALENQQRDINYKTTSESLKAAAKLAVDNRRLTLNENKFDFAKDKVFAQQVYNQITDSTTQVKLIDSKIEDVEKTINELPTKPRYYGDTTAEGYAAEKAKLTALRDSLVSQRAELQNTGDALRAKYGSFIDGTRSDGSSTTVATETPTKTTKPGYQMESWKQAKAAADFAMSKKDVETANKIWEDYKTEFGITKDTSIANTPPKEAASTTTTTPKASEATEVKPKLSAKEQEEANFNAAFLASMNKKSDWEILGEGFKNTGRLIAAPFVAFGKKYENDLKAQGALFDAFAAKAQAIRNNKKQFDALSPTQQENIIALSEHTSSKMMENQQKSAETMLTIGTLAAGAGLGTMTIKGIIKAVAAKAAKDSFKSNTPKIEKDMAQLKQTLLRMSEKERIAKLRALGYKSDNIVKVLEEMNKPIAGRDSSVVQKPALFN